MGSVIRLADFRWSWKEIFTAFGRSSTLHVHMNTGTGSTEISIINDEGEAQNIILETTDAVALHVMLTKALATIGK